MDKKKVIIDRLTVWRTDGQTDIHVQYRAGDFKLSQLYFSCVTVSYCRVRYPLMVIIERVNLLDWHWFIEFFSLEDNTTSISDHSPYSLHQLW